VGELEAAGVDLTELGAKAAEPALCYGGCAGVVEESGRVCEDCEPLSWIWLSVDEHGRSKSASHWRDLGAR